MINQDSHPKPHKGDFIQCLKGTGADRVLLFLLLLGIALLWFQINQSLAQGVPTAYVYHQKQLLAAYPLPTDEQVIHVAAKGELGLSEIEISKQGIRFLSSPCATHYCTLAGQKSYAGSVLACVPNHIMVLLRGSSAKSDDQIHFDAITE